MSPRLFILLGALLATAACDKPPAPAPAPPPAAARPAEARRYFGSAADGKLHVYFFDVGQGDAALIVTPDGRTVLVDTGPADAAKRLVNRLPELLTQRLDLVVLTHPHKDHYGAVEAVLRRVGARQLMEPQLGIGPDDYDAVLGNIAQQGVQVISPAPSGSTPNAPIVMKVGADVELNVLWPRTSAEELLQLQNAEAEVNSMVIRLTYGDTAVLFTGDARAQTVAHLLARNASMRATLLKVPAHGAEGPTTGAFLQAVKPHAAVISVGKGNAGAPAAVTLKTLESAGVRVFRTDQDGEVEVVSDGKTLTVTPQRLPRGAAPGTVYSYPGLSAANTLAAAPAVKPEEPVKGPDGLARVPRQAQLVDVDLDAPQDVQPGTRPSRPARPPRDSVSGPAPAGGYVASVNGKVYHVPSCPIVNRIKPGNRVEYKTVAEIPKHLPAHNCIH